MDNATKALVMAGEVLIAVLVLSLAVWVITTFGKYSKDTNSRLAQDRIAQYNNNFYLMNGRINITADEIATLLNFAKENNDSYELSFTNTEKSIYFTNIKIIENTINPSDYKDSFFSFGNDHIIIAVGGTGKTSITKAQFKDAINDFLRKNNDYYFSCNAKINSVNNDTRTIKYSLDESKNEIKKNDTTGLVSEITFEIVTKKPDSNSVLKEYTLTNKEKFTLEKVE